MQGMLNSRLDPAGYNRTLGISDEAYMLVNGAVDSALGRLALMPLVVLAARLCPQGVEATVFGLLMSLHIASFMCGKVFGSMLMDAFGVTSTSFVNLPALMMVRCSHWPKYIVSARSLVSACV